MDRDALGHFLRARREALLPAEVGLRSGGRRRTPGLRRSEVALLADVSVDYYERLERAHAGRPSEKLLDALAGVLRMTTAEKTYLFRLADYAFPTPSDDHGQVEPELLFVLDSLTDVPAHVVDDLTTVLAQNALSKELFGPWAQRTGRGANAAWLWFTEPGARVRHFLEDDPETGRQYVAVLRAASAIRGSDSAFVDLVAALTDHSSEFAQYWNAMEVDAIQTTEKTLSHVVHGRLDVSCDATRSAASGHTLLVMRPLPGTSTAASFRALAAESTGDRA